MKITSLVSLAVLSSTLLFTHNAFAGCSLKVQQAFAIIQNSKQATQVLKVHFLKSKFQNLQMRAKISFISAIVLVLKYLLMKVPT